MPTVKSVGIDPVRIGLIVTINLGIGNRRHRWRASSWSRADRQGVDLGSDEGERLVHRHVGSGAAHGDLRARDRHGTRPTLLPLKRKTHDERSDSGVATPADRDRRRNRRVTNALNEGDVAGNGVAVDTLADEPLRCVIVRGAGEKVFGPATTSRSSRPSGTRRRRSTMAASCTGRPAARLLPASGSSQIHGICVGGQLDRRALRSADLREIEPFWSTDRRISAAMAYTEMAPLVRLAGCDVALVLLEGRIFDAAEAKEKRLVTRVVPDALVAVEALTAAERIADAAPPGRSLAQELRAWSSDPRPLTAAEHDECFAVFYTEDFLPRLRGIPRQAEARIQRTMTSATAHPGPLAGMRVLELAQIMAGPTCGFVTLADMGADAIKVEKLPGGDDARGYREPRVNGVSAPFMTLNRNKRGIAIDLSVPR